VSGSSILQVLAAAGLLDRPSEVVMFEDSMKNIRAAKALGLRTVLLLPQAPDSSAGPRLGASDAAGVAAGEAEGPDPTDPSVDVVLRECRDIRTALPCLWKKKWVCS